MKSQYLAVFTRNNSDSNRSNSSGDHGAHKYEAIPTADRELQDGRSLTDVDVETQAVLEEHLRSFRKRNKRKLAIIIMVVIGLIVFFYFAVAGISHPTQSCDSIQSGYECQPSISHFWGQYSPYYTVPSEIDPELPPQCQITFAQILSRHGARDPTASKTIKYAEIIERIHNDTTSYGRDYAFIKDYKYLLGADQLSVFGQKQMINSGIKYYHRYQDLARRTTPFVRTAGADRVVESALNWTQGFHDARIKDEKSKNDDGYPYNMVVISEDTGSNNTLDHGLCTEFESGFDSTIGDSAQASWVSIFTPPILSRLMANLPGVNFTNQEAVYMMDLCPFNTVANEQGNISPFCALFTESEWQAYDYYQSLGKYYGYSWGNPLGATQGVGFTNELIARLTNSPVNDHTSTNSTLDDNKKTFPVGKKTSLYADFSHDNDLTAIFSALGLYNSTKPLLNTTLQSVYETNGYSASWTVPFAARAYFEKMACVGVEEELVRVIVNDRVLPLETCGGDEFGRCTLSAFVDSLSFAKAGGDWDKCIV